MAKKQKKGIKGLRPKYLYGVFRRRPEIKVRLWPKIHKDLLDNAEKGMLSKSDWVGIALFNFFRQSDDKIIQAIKDYSRWVK